jgi:hypothetical protein
LSLGLIGKFILGQSDSKGKVETFCLKLKSIENH